MNLKTSFIRTEECPVDIDQEFAGLIQERVTFIVKDGILDYPAANHRMFALTVYGSFLGFQLKKATESVGWENDFEKPKRLYLRYRVGNLRRDFTYDFDWFFREGVNRADWLIPKVSEFIEGVG